MAQVSLVVCLLSVVLVVTLLVFAIRRSGASESGLRLSEDDRILAGVCGGFAEYFGVPTFVTRALMLLAFLPGGVPGMLLYGFLWLVMVPHKKSNSGRSHSRPRADDDIVILNTGPWRLIEMVETGTDEEPTITENRTVDNSSGSGTLTRTLTLTSKWTKSYTVETLRTRTTSSTLGIGIEQLGVIGGTIETEIRQRYRIEAQEEHTHQEEISVEVPARTMTRIHVQWKKIWQTGNAIMKNDHGQVLEVPYRVVTGVTFDVTGTDVV